MRGSRHYDSEPGNASFKKDDLILARNKEKEGLLLVDNLFLGTETFKNFLTSQINELNDKEINVDLKKKIRAIYGKNNSTFELISDYNTIYDIEYLRNWGLMLSIISVCIVVANVFKPTKKQ
jgi:hypothetical protein